MELDTNVLTLVAVMAAVIWWKTRETLNDLRSRATEELQRAQQANHGEDESGGPSNRKYKVGDNDRLSAKTAARLETIRTKDASFDFEQFLSGACLVYENVIGAFANGDHGALREHLSADVLESFLQSIEAREEKAERAELTLIGMRRADIAAADISGGRIEITVDFESEIVTATRDEAGMVVAGDPAQIVIALDRWTFAKDLNAAPPVWKLVTTASPPPLCSLKANDSNADKFKRSDRRDAPEKIPGVGAVRVTAEPRAHH